MINRFKRDIEKIFVVNVNGTVADGAEFVQDFIFLDGVNDLELGAFYAGLLKWFDCPRLVGMAAKGFGLFNAIVGAGEITLSH